MIAGVVAVGIVDRLEVINISDEQGQRVVVSLGAFKFFLNFLFKGSAIKETR